VEIELGLCDGVDGRSDDWHVLRFTSCHYGVYGCFFGGDYGTFYGFNTEYGVGCEIGGTEHHRDGFGRWGDYWQAIRPAVFEAGFDGFEGPGKFKRVGS
jgi:hypothetical protein